MLQFYRFIAIVIVLVSSGFAKADLAARWTQTSLTGSGTSMGDPVSLTWGFIPDGTTIVGSEGTSPSDLVAFLDTQIGGGAGNDLTNRPWFALFDSAYSRWGQVSGLSFQYEPNDDGVTLSNVILPGELGVRADMRIGGHFIDGQSGPNVLAYNYFPNHGDMVIDTSNTAFYSSSTNNFRGLRNVVMHEAGHGLGLDHRESSNSSFLMEPFINNSFDGPQFDDIWSLQRGYGDVLEKAGGNDTFGSATNLGSLADLGSFSIGNDAVDMAVAATDIDFVSIDGATDQDFFTFTVAESGFLDLVLDPMGPTYQKGPQDGAQSPFNASAQSDLLFELFADDMGSLALVNLTGLGQSESLLGFAVDAGQYFVRVQGTQDITQLYRLQGNFVAVPEPNAILAVVCLASTGFLRRRR